MFTKISLETICFNLTNIKNTSNKLAFTLAEVLVTITVIGAIAAMTLPNLNSHFKKIEYSTKLKNFVSNMDRAIELMELEKVSFKEMKRPANYTEAVNWYMNNIDPYMGHKYKKGLTVYYNDGSSLGHAGMGGCWDVIYDVNGNKKPNIVGIDSFYFDFCFDDTNRAAWTGGKNIFFGPASGGLTAKSVTRDIAKNTCKNNRYKCAKLLELDGWEFKADYPYKIK